MRSTPIYDDFTGFTFNGVHCSQFGLVRVSDGDRYEDDLVLDHSNESADVPGGVGQYYWGEQIKERKFPINIAYDTVTEKEKREIRHWLHPDDKLHELIFDEKPYVKYFVKCTKSVTAKELCFNEDGGRVYKGEMDIEFTAFMPYGVERWRHIPVELRYQGEIEFSGLTAEYGNAEEWFEASGLLRSEYYLHEQEIDVNHYGNITLYNPGDVETGFELTFEKEAAGNYGKYMGTSSPSSSYYTPINQKEIDCAQNTFYIFSPYLAEIDGTNDNVEVFLNGTVIDNGYIDTTGDYAVFVSNINGNIYDIFEYISEDWNTGQTTIDFSYPIENLKRYYGICNGKKVSFYQDSYGFIYCLDRGRSAELYSDIIMSFAYDVYINFTLLAFSGYYFLLKIPSAATTDPQYWTEAQKMLSIPCQVKIDTNKQTIQYREIIDKTNNIYGNWIGISGVLSEGSLFKIPNSSSEIGLTIQSDELEITNISIKYPYLYI